MSDIKSGVYSINNLINNKCYIGSAVNIKVRWYTHKYTLMSNSHKNKHLQSAWNKYGADNFSFEILELISDLEELIPREQYWIDQLNAFTYGYNIKPKAGSSLGFKYSEESKDKMRKKALGRKHSVETKQKWSLLRKGNKNGMYGKNHSEKTIQKIRENRSNAEGENNPFYNKYHTQETKDLISKKNKGRVQSAEERAMRSVINSGEKNPFFGKKQSTDIIIKLKESFTQERKDKISERMKLNNPNKDGKFTKKVPVLMLDKNTNEILKYFKSGVDAGNYIKSLNLTKAKYPGNSIYDVCKGKQITAFGYKWKYTNEIENSN